jgi:hypothetical protein
LSIWSLLVGEVAVHMVLAVLVDLEQAPAFLLLLGQLIQ